MVENGVDDFARGHGALDGGEKVDELPTPVLLHAMADDRSLENVQGREQGRPAVPFETVRHGSAFPWFEWQAELGAVERLNLAFLVDRDDDGVRWRVHVEANDNLDLFCEFRVIRAFEGSDAVRLETMLLPNAPCGPQRNPHGLGHGASGPMGRGARRLGAGQFKNSGDDLGRERRAAGLASLVAQQAVDAFLAKALLSAPDGRVTDADSARDFQDRKPIGGVE